LRPLNPFLKILRAHLRPHIMDGLDVSGLLHDPERWSGILRSRCLGILRSLRRSILRDLWRAILKGLYGRDIRPRIFLGRPSLELPEQGFRRWLAPFGLILTGWFGGGNFVAGRPVLRGRWHSLSIGGSLNGWRRRNRC
jgi:hypothetical protein